PKDAEDLGTKQITAAHPIALNFALGLPPLNHLTEGAPISVRVTDGTRTLYSATLSPPTTAGTHPKLAAAIPADALDASAKELYITLYYTRCSEGLSAVCTPAQASWKLTPSFTQAAEPSAFELTTK
ncbi:MAG TPA: hypothetical protein VHM90_14645, partial [Phycisphaerae bacterium]|nr:hypothetical protein [Phycisphaerae bacterium]